MSRRSDEGNVETEVPGALRRFEACARAAPAAVAVVHRDARATYLQLREAAAAVAASLRARGVVPGARVAVCLDRSVHQIATVLGVLEAGCTYVPLDPRYPPARLASMARTAALTAIVSDEASPFAASQHARDTLIGRRWVDGRSPLLPLGGEDVRGAYLMHTSGSSGVPKGVLVTHANVEWYVDALGSRLGIASSDRYLHTASFAFSSSVRQLLLPLSIGATVVLADVEEVGDLRRLVDRSCTSGVTTWDLVPSVWRALTSSLERDARMRERVRRSDLRRVVSASEPLTVDVPARWRALFGASHALVNMYGLTETCGIVCVHELADGDALGSDGTVPLGRPLDGLSVRVVDPASGADVPQGEAGELRIAGPAVALGYVPEQPGLDAGRFVVTPEGGRAFWTGDWCRERGDGSLAFVGRRDQVVKLRGMRVEIAEVEAALGRGPAVDEVVVVARTRGDHVELVAFFVGEASEEALVAAATARLPEHMLPRRVHRLARMPRTPNGKVDRAALLALPDERSAGDRAGTEIERELVGICARLLSIEAPFVSSSFFAAGGNSLSAALLVHEIELAFGARLSLRDVYGSLTLRELAGAIAARAPDPSTRLAARALRGGMAVPRPRTRARSAAEWFPASFAEERIAVYERSCDRQWIQTPLAYRLTGALRVDAFVEAVQSVWRRHAILRSTYRSSGHRLLKRILPPDALPVADVDRRDEPPQGPDEISARILREALEPFDLEHGPLVRCRLERVADAEWIASWFIHHYVFDNSSIAILQRDLGAFYAAAVSGRPASVAPLAYDFDDFAAWERETLDDTRWSEGLAFWSGELARAPSVTDRLGASFRRGRDVPPLANLPGDVRLSTVSGETIAGIKRVAAQTQSTFAMVCLAAFAAALHRRTSVRFIPVFCAHDQRRLAGMADLIGYLSNPLLLVLDTSALERGPAAFAASVRDAVVRAHEHAEFPFVPGTTRSIADSLQIVFNYRESRGEPSFQDVAVERIPLSRVRLGCPYDVVWWGERRSCDLAIALMHREAVLTRPEAAALLDETSEAMRWMASDS